MTDLLPCPFCGGDAAMGNQRDKDGSMLFFVNCADCLASTNAINPCSMAITPEEAAEAWNHRAISMLGQSIIADTKVLEAGRMTIGDPDGWHMIIDGKGQRIYDGDKLLRKFPP